MRWSIEFGGDPQDVTITTSGKATPEGFDGMNTALLEHERFRPGLLVLLDHSDLDVASLTTEDVHRIAEDFSRHGELRSLSVAMIAPSPLQYARARLSTLLAEAERGVLIFATRDEALDWLRQMRDAGPDVSRRGRP